MKATSESSFCSLARGPHSNPPPPFHPGHHLVPPALFRISLSCQVQHPCPRVALPLTCSTGTVSSPLQLCLPSVKGVITYFVGCWGILCCPIYARCSPRCPCTACQPRSACSRAAPGGRRRETQGFTGGLDTPPRLRGDSGEAQTALSHCSKEVRIRSVWMRFWSTEVHTS